MDNDADLHSMVSYHIRDIPPRSDYIRTLEMAPNYIRDILKISEYIRALGMAPGHIRESRRNFNAL